MSPAQAAAYLQPIFDSYGGRPIVTISHPDQDHYNYIPTVMGNRFAQSIWLGGNWNDYDATIRNWIGAQNAAGVPVYYGFPAGWHADGHAVGELTCGWASTYVMTVNVGTTTNSQSLVARVQYNAFSITFTGDATGATQRSVVSNFLPSFVPTVILTGSHHGASTDGSNDAAWAQASQPKVTVFSSGTSYYHPRCEAVAVYERYLQPMPVHPIWCGTSTGYYPPFNVGLGEYVTEINGIVMVVTDGSAFGVACSRSAC